MNRPVPPFVYKIVEHKPQVDMPSELPLSALDIADGFIHLSDQMQVTPTAAKWFASYAKLFVLEVDTSKSRELIGHFRWADNGETGCIHLYAEQGKLASLGKDTISRIFEWDRKHDRWDEGSFATDAKEVKKA